MNIVFCAYAHKENYCGGHNMKAQDAKNVYLKNSFVALKSCKAHNPTVDVALVTNVNLSDYWKELFQRNSISVIFVEYDCFLFDEKYGWSLAFYKLCALKHVVAMGYENTLLIDTDTYVQRKLDDVWKESKHNILLFDISRGLYNGDYRTFAEEAKEFLGTEEFLTRWGGEFIAGNREFLCEFIQNCEYVYDRMKQEKFRTINGDEFVLSIAAWKMRAKIKNAAAYVFRYWTAYRWHYVCSNYSANPVCVLHCPREKNYGFLKLFRWMEKRETLPHIRKVYRALSLDLWSYIKIEFIKGIAHLKN